MKSWFFEHQLQKTSQLSQEGKLAPASLIILLEDLKMKYLTPIKVLHKTNKQNLHL